jgi:hypothetical protein
VQQVRQQLVLALLERQQLERQALVQLERQALAQLERQQLVLRVPEQLRVHFVLPRR